MTLMAIDPGPHTGLAVKIGNDYHTATITDPKELWDMLAEYKPAFVAYEDFIGSGMRDININQTIQLVGSITGICHILNIKAVRQQPQARRPFILDARRMLVNQEGKTTHEVDALAHLLLLEYRMIEGKL